MHCYIKLQQYEQVVKYGQLILQTQPKHLKAFYRLSIAYQALNQLDLAKRNVQLAIEMDPSNVAVRKEWKKIQDWDRQAQKKQKQMYQNMFKSC